MNAEIDRLRAEVAAARALAEGAQAALADVEQAVAGHLHPQYVRKQPEALWHPFMPSITSDGKITIGEGLIAGGYFGAPPAPGSRKALCVWPAIYTNETPVSVNIPTGQEIYDPGAAGATTAGDKIVCMKIKVDSTYGSFTSSLLPTLTWTTIAANLALSTTDEIYIPLCDFQLSANAANSVIWVRPRRFDDILFNVVERYPGGYCASMFTGRTT